VTTPEARAVARERVLGLLKEHGWNATSFQVLEPAFDYWLEGGGCVAYVDTGGAWVVAGAPIGPPGELQRLCEGFVAAARARGKRVAFFAVEARLLALPGVHGMLVGEQPVWDPRAWPSSLAASPSLREQLRRARAKGVAVRPATPEELEAQGGPVRRGVERLIALWLGGKALAPMGFLVDLHPFSFARERRYFVAEANGALVGFLSCVPVYVRGGWLFEDLLRDPAAPNGTTELLIDAAMTAVAAEGSTYATLGLAPLAGPVQGGLRLARAASRSLYDFDGLRAFKAKLRPHAWEPIYLAWPAGGWGAIALYDTLAAFAHGSFTRFGLRTLLRGPALVVRGLTVLLALWLPLLALAEPARWFPSQAVQHAWVAFDVCLLGGLLLLDLRWRRWLAGALAVLVTADALVTTAEAALFNAPRARHPVEWLVLAASCLAPALAATALWGALFGRPAPEAPPGR
jgi:phosphatidylglycerol lysyltransferase